MSGLETNSSLSGFHQHKGERSVGKAIKGSMVQNDSFVYFRIRSGIKECNKIKSETMKEREPRSIYQPTKIIYISLEIPHSKFRLIKHKKWKEIIH